MDINDIRNEFRTGDMAVYPLIIKSSTNPNAGKIKFVSAKKFGKWHEIDHYGETPINTWKEAIVFLEREIENLRELNALSYVSQDEVRSKYEKLNEKSKIIGFDSLEFMEITDTGIENNVELNDIAFDSPRFKEGYWEPILEAWINSLNKLQEHLQKGRLIDP